MDMKESVLSALNIIKNELSSYKEIKPNSVLFPTENDYDEAVEFIEKIIDKRLIEDRKRIENRKTLAPEHAIPEKILDRKSITRRMLEQEKEDEEIPTYRRRTLNQDLEKLPTYGRTALNDQLEKTTNETRKTTLNQDLEKLPTYGRTTLIDQLEKRTNQDLEKIEYRRRSLNDQLEKLDISTDKPKLFSRKVEESFSLKEKTTNDPESDDESLEYSPERNYPDEYESMFKGKESRKNIIVRSPIISKNSRIQELDYSDSNITSSYVDKMYEIFDIDELKIDINIYNIDPYIRQDGIETMMKIMFDHITTIKTLFISVQLMDRYLSYNTINPQEIKTISASCCILALKYEEIYPPELEDIAKEIKIKTKDLIKYEEKVISLLNFDLNKPNIYTFISRYVKINESENLKIIATYIAFQTFFEIDFYKYIPSLLASCSVYIARQILDLEPWNENLIYYTRYYEENLIEPSKLLLNLTKNSIRNKKELNKKFFDVMGFDLTLRISQKLKTITIS